MRSTEGIQIGPITGAGVVLLIVLFGLGFAVDAGFLLSSALDAIRGVL